jgi:hypothetical protein
MSPRASFADAEEHFQTQENLAAMADRQHLLDPVALQNDQ